MIDRFINRRIFLNDSPIYHDLFEERGTKYISQYNTPVFNHYTENELEQIDFVEHIWTTGDRLYKLAGTYLGDKLNWWVILKFNKIGSEALIKKGDIIKIPVRVEDVIGKLL